MFGKGNWSVFGVKKESLVQFKESLANEPLLLELSQLAAGTKCKFSQKDATGINPFATPRKDEKINQPKEGQASFNPFIVRELLERLNEFLEGPPKEETLSIGTLMTKGINLTDYMDFFAMDESEFQINPSFLWYGFWVVTNSWKDVAHIASKKEQLSYDKVSRPYTFLNKDEKKAVDAVAAHLNAVERKQFPVLIDFEEGRVYAETTTPQEIDALYLILRKLGVELQGLRWEFGESNWPTQFLKYVADNSKFQDEMAKRAEELTRFTKEEVEKLENKMMEKIVSTYFALTELPNAQWAGLSTTAQIKLHPASDPIAASSTSNAFTLLHIDDEAAVHGAAVTIQELATRVKKTGEETLVRTDVLKVVVDTNVNNQDIGTALLRGFDVPQYKRDIIREIKKTKTELSINQYWSEWLRQMRAGVFLFAECVKEALQLPGNNYGLIPYELASEEGSDEVIEVQ